MKSAILMTVAALAALTLYPSLAMAEEMGGEDSMTEIQVSWINIAVNDIDEMRHFYSELIGLNEYAYHLNENFGMLAYDCGGFYFAFVQAFQELPVESEISHSPSYGPKPYYGTSFSIEVDKVRFDEIVGKMKDEGVKSATDEPETSYHGEIVYRALDPMGYTVEIYYVPEEEKADMPGM